MSRKSLKDIKLSSYVNCQRIYPVEDTKKTVDKLKTIGMKLTKKQAVDLATSLLAAALEWDTIDITGYRKTHLVTITSETGSGTKKQAGPGGKKKREVPDFDLLENDDDIPDSSPAN